MQKKNGKIEGRLRVYREDGSFIEKSFTRKTEAEIRDIKANLTNLGIIANDIIAIEIDKHTNKITLIKKDSPLLTPKQVKLDKNILVVDYINYWLWNHRRRGQKGTMIKDSTFEDYVTKTEYLKKLITKTTLNNGKEVELKVTDLTFEFMESKILEFNSYTAYSTVVQVRNHLYNLMKWAKKDGIININPFDENSINLPQNGLKKERAIIKEDDVESVIELCLKRWYIDVLTQLMTGARVGEIRGLIWSNIHFDDCEIQFENSYDSVKQYKYENGKIISLGRKRRYSTLKSGASYRTIKIDKDFMKVLEIHKALQEELAQKLKKPFSENIAVFTTKTYTPLGRNVTNDIIKSIVKELEIKNWDKITSHCLRHGFCYEGLLNDVPLEYMQLLLGHSNIAVTRKWYAHFNKSKINSYAQKVNENRMAIIRKIENNSNAYNIAQ